eukprot:2095654-Rhodomonas_salina.1
MAVWVVTVVLTLCSVVEAAECPILARELLSEAENPKPNIATKTPPVPAWFPISMTEIKLSYDKARVILAAAPEVVMMMPCDPLCPDAVWQITEVSESHQLASHRVPPIRVDCENAKPPKPEPDTTTEREPVEGRFVRLPAEIPIPAKENEPEKLDRL